MDSPHVAARARVAEQQRGGVGGGAGSESLNRFAAEKLAQLDRRELRRTLVTTARHDGVWAMRDGRRLLSFSCNDYLNLTSHPAVLDAAAAAARRHGAGAGASRLVTGNHPLYDELEQRLARFKGARACCVFGSGYLANLGIIPTVVGHDDLLLVDELAHASIWAGAQLARGDVVAFRHNDVAHLGTLLAARRGRHPRVLIATDGVFSMDGDLAPVAALAALARRFDAWLMVDDAHGLGVLGEGGRGSIFAAGATPDVPLQVGTLSKALAACGGFLCASRPVVDLMKTRARPLIYSTGLPPAAVGAALAALDEIERMPPERLGRPLAKARAFTDALGLPAAESPIVSVVVGEARAALRASAVLEEAGFLVVAIRPPTVPAGTARLRFAFTASHPDDEVERLAGVVRSRVLDACEA